MELNRPADAKERFLQALKRTPGRPKAIYGIAQAAQATGDTATARQRYQQFLELWKNAGFLIHKAGLTKGKVSAEQSV